MQEILRGTADAAPFILEARGGPTPFILNRDDPVVWP